jgi:carbamoyltransferase
MIVLAIHDGHDAGCCLLRDGEIVVHSSEERRCNDKNRTGVPEQSIRAVFAASGIAPADVDLVALCGRIRTTPVTREVRTIHKLMRVGYRLARSRVATRAGQWVLARTADRSALHAFLAGLGLGATAVEAFDHHQVHAATAYYHRPFDGDALVFTHDGAGDGLCATVSVGRGFELERIAWTTKFHSPANFLYSSITAHLGLKPWEHEYKVMGMAPYGRAEHCASALREMFAVDGLEFRNRTGVIGPSLDRLYAERLRGQRFDNVAAACQLVFEELVLEWVRNAMQATGLRKVVAAGGAFLNVKANKLVRELPGVEAFYAYPASDDGGQPIGGAVLGYLSLCRARGVAPQLRLPRHMYLGLEHTEDEMARAAAASGLPWRRMMDPVGELARLLAEGRIVARFAGREEVGPRSLGNRSILADPRDLKTVRKLNFAIKQRDFWMPFAASVLEEDAPRYIRGLSRWPFWMIEAFDTTPAGAEALAAGIHPFDETVRPQVVNDLNPDYRDLIRAFKRRTGIGGLLNTSFNLHGSPIVGSPAVAVETLQKSGLDALALGPFLVEKPR